jgi:hypothetical protein
LIRWIIKIISLQERVMKFSLLLFILMVIFKRTARKYESFRTKLKEKNYTLVIRTEDGRRGRYYTFRDGAIISGKGDFPGAEISLVWRDAATGFRIMAGGSTKAFMAALQDGSLKLAGDANLALAFMGAVGEMMKLMKIKK